MSTQQVPLNSKPDIASIITDARNPKFDEELTNHVKLGDISAVDQILTGANVTPFVKRNIMRDAIAFNQLSMITHLIKRDDFASDLMLWDVATESKYNLLDYAIVLDKTEVALHILAHHVADLHQTELPCSFTLAVERNNRDVLRALLQHSRHAYFVQNYQEQINEALVTAAQRGFTGTVEEILTKNHLDPDVAHIGQAIKLATTHGHINIIDMLAKTYHFDLSDDQWELFRAACLAGQAHVITWLLLQVQVRVDHMYLVDTFLTVVKSEKQPVDVVRVLLDHTNISFATDVQHRKLLLFLKRHLRHEMFETLCTHLVAKGHDVHAILMGEKWSQTELATMLKSPEMHDHTKLLLACINAGDLDAIKQLLQVSSSVDLTANEYKALQKAIEFNSRDIAMLFIHHPSFKMTSFKFVAVLNDCLQRVKSEKNSNMMPRLDLLKELVHALKFDMNKMIDNLEAKYIGGMMPTLLRTLAKQD